jgi:hypothetical protein
MMNTVCRKSPELLRERGWDVRLAAKPRAFLQNTLSRYAWLPDDIRQLLEEAIVVVSPEKKSWFNTSSETAGENGSAFAWNEWELMSLSAAEDFPKLQPAIRAFWDRHFPFLISVKSGYAYFAVRQADLAVVCGEKPEFEEATPIADSVEQLLDDLIAGASHLAIWI